MLNMDIIRDVKNYELVSLPGTVTPTSSTPASTAGTGDTGASICCTGTDMLGKLGIKRTELLKTNVDLYVADKCKLTILGVVF